MGWLDNVIATVSPRRAYEREMWRQGLDELRGYDAAGHGRINSGWRAVNESAEITDRYSRDVVRARARDLERNSCQRHLKMSFSAEIECHFSPGSIQVYTALITGPLVGLKPVKS